MMDCLGLLGEKPMMPAPPKVWPLRPAVMPAAVLALAALGSVGVVPPVEFGMPLLAVSPVAAQFEVLLDEVLSVAPKDEVDEKVVEALPPNGFGAQPPVPPSGCPKKPITVGALF